MFDMAFRSLRNLLVEVNFMIAYRDFAPTQVSAPGLFKAATYETLDQALAAANSWIQSNDIHVLNVETVVLPNLHALNDKGTSAPSLVLQPGFAEAWSQFFRIWYRVN